MKNQQKSYIYALSAVLLWSTAASAFKIALRHIDFFQLLFWSVGVSIGALFIILSAQKKTGKLLHPTKKELLASALNGLLNPYLYYVVLFKAYSMLPAQLAQPLNYLWPVMLVLLSVPLLGQKLTKQSIFAAIAGFAGVYVIATRGRLFDFQIQQPAGVLLAAGSSVIWALFWILNQRDKRDEAVKLFWNFVFGFVYIAVTLPFFSDFIVPKAAGLSAAVYVGLFEMGITFFLWMKALQLTDKNDKISSLVFLSPFLSLLFIRIVLQEQIYSTTLPGLLLIILGIAVMQKKKGGQI